MLHASRIALALCLAAGFAAAGDAPLLSYLEMTTVSPWGRISIHGTNLDQAGQVHVGGVEAMVMPIQGTNAVEMNAYVPDSVPYGTWDVVVTTSAGVSNPLTLNVVPRTPDGRALWRFTMNTQTMLHRPALGADGTIYAKSAAGDLIALTPTGDMKWLYQLGGDWKSTIDVGLDGTIYTADGWPTIHAVNPDGTQKWTFQAPLTNGLLSGPNVGPDGNIYAVAHAPGIGIFSLDPDGNLRWEHAAPEYSPIGQQGQELVFSDTQLFLCHNGNFDSFDFDGNKLFDLVTVTQYNDSSPQPAVGPSGDSYLEYWGRLQSFDPSGNLNWIAFDVGGSYLRDPDVGPDGTIYVMRNVFNTFWALNADGSVQWSYNHPHPLQDPVASPDGETIVVGGGTSGGASFFLGLGTDGTPLWEHELPIEQPTPFGSVVVHPQGRARFTPDGSVAYVMASGEAGSPGYSYVYALQVAPCVEIGHALPGSAGTPRLQASGTLEPGSPLSVTLTNVMPNSLVWILVGSEPLAAPFMGGVLVPVPDIIEPFGSDANGSLQISTTWPSNLASGTTAYVQVWIPDLATPQGFAASNAVSLITP